MTSERNDNRRRRHEHNGGLNYCLEVFGDHLAKREGYRESKLDGMDAIHFYLVHKFHWLLRDVRAMSAEDIRFVLTEEMYGWTTSIDTKLRLSASSCPPAERP